MKNSRPGDAARGGTPQPAARSRRGTAGRVQLAVSLAPLAAGLLAIVAVIGLIGFAVRSPQPHDIPVGLVGPPAAEHQVSAEFGASAPGAFEFTSYASPATARAALDGRDVDAVLTVGPGRSELVVAGAAGAAIAGVITTAVSGAFRAQGTPLTVQTVHAFAPGDPQGLILFFAVLAVLIASLLAGALVGLRSGTGWRARLAILAAHGLVAGPVAMSMEAWVAASFGSGFWRRPWRRPRRAWLGFSGPPEWRSRRSSWCCWTSSRRAAPSAPPCSPPSTAGWLRGCPRDSSTARFAGHSSSMMRPWRFPSWCWRHGWQGGSPY